MWGVLYDVFCGAVMIAGVLVICAQIAMFWKLCQVGREHKRRVKERDRNRNL